MSKKNGVFETQYDILLKHVNNSSGVREKDIFEHVAKHIANCISNGMPTGSFEDSVDTTCSDSPGVDSTAAESSDDDDDGGGSDDPEPARRRSSKHPSQAVEPIPSGTARNAKPQAGASRKLLLDQDIALWRLPTVLAHVPVSRSGWWAGVKSGRYPQPVRLSARCVAWRSADIRTLIESL